MPKYDYRCKNEACGIFEVEQRITDDALTICPTCGEEVKKLFSSPSMLGFPNGPKNTAPTYNPNRSALWNSAQAP